MSKFDEWLAHTGTMAAGNHHATDHMHPSGVTVVGMIAGASALGGGLYVDTETSKVYATLNHDDIPPDVRYRATWWSMGVMTPAQLRHLAFTLTFAADVIEQDEAVRLVLTRYEQLTPAQRAEFHARRPDRPQPPTP